MYIFEINPLSVASLAIIFSQSEGCLFTLLIVSFVVQKLLSLIRSHLFIFNFLIEGWADLPHTVSPRCTNFDLLRKSMEGYSLTQF